MYAEYMLGRPGPEQHLNGNPVGDVTDYCAKRWRE
jgi:hypothetical protein